MQSAFGVEHGDVVSKGGGFATERSPYGGGKWGPNATPEKKKKFRERQVGTGATAIAGGGLVGGIVSQKPFKQSRSKKVGAAMIAGGLAGNVANSLKAKKEGVALPRGRS